MDEILLYICLFVMCVVIAASAGYYVYRRQKDNVAVTGVADNTHSGCQRLLTALPSAGVGQTVTFPCSMLPASNTFSQSGKTCSITCSYIPETNISDWGPIFTD